MPLPKPPAPPPAATLEAKMRQIRDKEKEAEASALAASSGLPYINLFRFAISPGALGLIPRAKAQELGVVCFLFTGPEIRLGAVDQANPAVAELAHELEERHHARSSLYVISQKSLDIALKLYDTLPAIAKRTGEVEIKAEDLERFKSAINSFAELNSAIQRASISDLVVVVLAAALKFNASDVHLEAEENQISIRFRLDGILNEVASLKKEIWQRIISRLKLVAGLKINISDKPQDGRFTIAEVGQKIDVRVSTVPTVYGESVVMRILRPAATGLAFDDLGIRGRTFDQLKRETERPNGMIVTTGPTGSGKTTTMYAIIKKLNQPGVKIITLEDPVEYKLEGINQSQIDPSRDYTFAVGLRSILRQDPDVVLVGEIRDLETAEVAIQAALTGHLMLSTIHTNSAAGAIPRFLSMGVKPFLLAPALNAVIGQRLVRLLCAHCKVPTKLDEETNKRVRDSLGQLPPDQKPDLDHVVFYTAPGCSQCNALGYQGRLGIYEVMLMNKEIEELLLKGAATEYTISEVAVRNGMVTMVQDGLLKAADGLTSVDEVFRVAE